MSQAEQLNATEVVRLNSEDKVKHFYHLGNNATFALPNGKGSHIAFHQGIHVTDDEESKTIIENWVMQTNHKGATKELYDENNPLHNPNKGASHFNSENDNNIINGVLGSQALAKVAGATAEPQNVSAESLLGGTPIADTATLQAKAEAANEAKEALAAAQAALAINLGEAKETAVNEAGTATPASPATVGLASAAKKDK